MAFRNVLATPLRRGTLVGFALLVILFNLILELSASLLIPAPEQAVTIPTATAFILHMVSILGGTALMFGAGRAFKGRGDFDGALKSVIWVSFVMLLAQGAFLLGILILPAAALVLMLLLLMFSMIQLSAVTMELHGFENPVLVGLGIIGAAIVLGSFMLILLLFLGIDLPVSGPPA
ncbi:MAG: hypothetical protein GDA53_01735 [Rhodobacteraceae bacterium]|nr:hypothetical protein [Paracoccaceae bacterium]